MNETNPPPPPFISQPPPESGADEFAPIEHLAAVFESLLRQPRRVIYRLTQADAAALICRLAVLAALLMLLYGLVVGAFSGGIQWWAAPLKITVGLGLSVLICLPSLYIFACLGGSRAGLRETVGLVAGLASLMAVLLVGFAPVAWVFSQSTESVSVMGMLHVLFALIAVSFGLRLVGNGLRQYGGTASGAVRVWAIIFILVMMQMTTALRPIVGTSDQFLPDKKQFFISHWLSSFDQDAELSARGK